MTRLPLPVRCALICLAFACLAAGSHGQNSIADLLDAPEANLSDPASRARVVQQARILAEQRRAEARARIEAMGLPARVLRPDGAIQEITDFADGQPIYFTTHNAAAAISTDADLARSTYTLDGNSILIGMWDGGSGRATHQEFGSRMIGLDGAASIDHATHVGGTLIASGVSASARGMAPAASVDSYDWNNDTSEMASRGATGPGQTDKIYLSNHSYGYVTGWNYVNSGAPFRVWEWYGNGTTSTGFEQDYGRYNATARDQDSIAYSAPYYLIFRSAGNDRSDAPAPGESVALSPGSSTVVSYDPALHPPGDGAYRGGYETISFAGLAKNVVTVGAVNDAVTNGSRDTAKATMSSFSCWGPTDDGRIKPDIVANGVSLNSSLNRSNTSYGNLSGTSMSSPNACGSAALLIQQYGLLFPGQAMRSSTLKGLLIHTADDLGNPGPDYQNGWGLVDTLAAADLISDHQAYPDKQRMTEAELNTSTTSVSYPFTWDGTSPIRATLCWTDPAGSATSTSDLRTARLVNNLNLKIIAPGGSEFLPYVMPFVGDWSQSSMSAYATTGINNTDNVEQVFIAAPPAPGTYQVIVSFTGVLTNNRQHFSLLIDGSSATPPPPPPLSISAVSPETGLPGPVTIDLTGAGFSDETTVTLTRSGQPGIHATSVSLQNPTSLRADFDLTGAAVGAWDLTAENPGGESFTLSEAFTLIEALWAESLDGATPPADWTSTATSGSNAWTITTDRSHSPTKSYFCPAPATRSTTNLTSPPISIPENATDIQVRIWHLFELQSQQDGGRIEFSLDGGEWFDVTSPSSGAVFASNGYNNTIRAIGRPINRSEFAGLQAFTGSSNGFLETIINLTDTTKYAGHSLRIRWRLATNNNTASTGWYVDTIALLGGGDFSNQQPTITSPAESAATETETDPVEGTVFEVVRAAAVELSVAANDDGEEPALTYTWSVVTGPGAPVFFSPNGTNAAKLTTANFEAPGDYQLAVAISDLQGLTVSSTANIRVLQEAGSIAVVPEVTSINVGGSQQFSATLLDQFGAPMVSQPSSYEWFTSGGGSISTQGLFSANAAGSYVITAASDPFEGIANLTVNPSAADVTLNDLTQTYDGSPKLVTATTNPAGLAVEITYDGSPSAPVYAGAYAVVATITDPNFQGSTSGELVIELPTTGFAAWQYQYFTAEEIIGGLADSSADIDQDGLANAIEYALGTHPKLPNPSPVTGSVQPDPDAVQRLTLTFDRPEGLADITYSVEFASTPGASIWDTLTEFEVLPGPMPGTETVVAHDTMDAGTSSLRFGRLRVKLTTP